MSDLNLYKIKTTLDIGFGRVCDEMRSIAGAIPFPPGQAERVYVAVLQGLCANSALYNNCAGDDVIFKDTVIKLAGKIANDAVEQLE